MYYIIALLLTVAKAEEGRHECVQHDFENGQCCLVLDLCLYTLGDLR